MSYQAPLSTEQMALLAAAFTILLGAAFPVIVLVRFALRWAARATLATVLEPVLKGAAVALAAALAFAFATPAPAHVVEKPAAAEACLAASPAPAGRDAAAADLDDAITQTFLSITGAAARPMPIFLLDTATRIYTAYKVHRIGQQAAEARRIAHKALTETAQVRAEIEAGRTLGERAQRIIRTRLEAHADRLDGLAQRVTIMEQQTARIEKTMGGMTKIVTRRGCSQFHAWNRKLQRCTDRR